MRLIPVLDLKDGLAVHAKLGDRAHYAPLASCLSDNTDVIELVRIFRDRFHFDTVYLADLNAITQSGNNFPLVAGLLAAFPKMDFWVDSGFPLPDSGIYDQPNYVPVIGTESLSHANRIAFSKLDRRFVLSLDFSADGPLDRAGLLADSAIWPRDVIVMTLAKVGSGMGPDVGLLSQLVQAHPKHCIAAAGGVRHRQDLLALENIGVKTCLIASALHNGELNPEEIADFRAKKYPD